MAMGELRACVVPQCHRPTFGWLCEQHEEIQVCDCPCCTSHRDRLGIPYVEVRP